MSAETFRMMSTPPVLISATWVAVSGTARKIRFLNAGFPRQCWSNASRRMSWSRFHSTNFQGPVPTGDVVPKAWSPTVSTCFLFTIGKKTSRSRSSGNGLSVMMWTVSASTTLTSLIARMLPYWGDFLVWSSTRSNEYFTSAGVRTSPLWKCTFLRILNSHWVSEIAFHAVASDGSNWSFVLRCSRESNMLMFTRIPTRSKCMWGSRVGAWDTRATVSVSLAWAETGAVAAASAKSARTRTAASGAHRFIGGSSSSADRDVDEGGGDLKGLSSLYHRPPGQHNAPPRRHDSPALVPAVRWPKPEKPMRVITQLPNDDLRRAQAAARVAEAAGFDGVVALENAHGPYLPLAAAALATERVQLG